MPLWASRTKIKAGDCHLASSLLEKEEIYFAHRAGSLAKLAKFVWRPRSFERIVHAGGNAAGRAPTGKPTSTPALGGAGRAPQAPSDAPGLQGVRLARSDRPGALAGQGAAGLRFAHLRRHGAQLIGSHRALARREHSSVRNQHLGRLLRRADGLKREVCILLDPSKSAISVRFRRPTLPDRLLYSQLFQWKRRLLNRQ